MADIRIAHFSEKTFNEWKVNPTKLHDRLKRKCGKGTIVVLVHKDLQVIIAVAVLGSDFRAHDLLDVDTYTGTDAKYNTYEADIESCRFFTHPVPLKDVKDLCGISKEYNLINNIFWPRVPNSWSEPYVTTTYKGEEIIDADTEKRILRRYRKLVMSWL